MTSFISEPYQYLASGIENNYPFVDQNMCPQNFVLKSAHPSDCEMQDSSVFAADSKFHAGNSNKNNELSTKNRKSQETASTRHLQSLLHAENELQSLFSSGSSQSSCSSSSHGTTTTTSLSQYEFSPSRGTFAEMPQLGRINSTCQPNNNSLLISRAVNPHVLDSAFIKETQSAKTSPLSVKLIKPTAVRSSNVPHTSRTTTVVRANAQEVQIQSSRLLNFQDITSQNNIEIGQEVTSFAFSPEFVQQHQSWTNDGNMLFYENPVFALPQYPHCQSTY